MTTRRSATLAFTLIELLAVVAIIGILATILVPTISYARTAANTRPHPFAVLPVGRGVRGVPAGIRLISATLSERRAKAGQPERQRDGHPGASVP
jgi:prepilin-type N-terminal cleavage/methylation domain-containing protein